MISEVSPAVSTEPLSLLRRAVEAFGAESCEGSDAGALRGELEAMRREMDQLEGEFARRLAILDRLREFFPDDQPTSLVGWLRNACRLSGPAAVERVEVARQLTELPLTGEALARGDIGYEHARVIARTATDLGTKAARAAEPTLVETAQEVDPSRLREVAQGVRQVIDPEGALQTARRHHERRRVRLAKNFEGAFHLEGLLDPEGGAILTAALNGLMAPLAGDSRTSVQRRADALVEIGRRHLQGGQAGAGEGARPQLTLTVPLAALREARRDGQVHPGNPDEGAPVAAAGTGASGVPQLSWAGAVPVEMARRIGCDATITTVVVDSRGTPLDVGRARRTIPPAMRRALAVRDRGCRVRGCDRPAEWTSAHHIEHWADGGPTKLSNLVLLCQPCHRRVHEQRWQLRWGDDGRLEVRPP